MNEGQTCIQCTLASERNPRYGRCTKCWCLICTEKDNPDIKPRLQNRCRECDHECHGNDSSCRFAYYIGYNSTKPPQIFFVQPNLLHSYYQIPRDIRGEHDELWNVFVTCSFYHELGHHLVQVYSTMLTEQEPNLTKEIKHWKASSFSDEQKLCEYIAFKLMHHNIGEMGKIILPKWYENKKRHAIAIGNIQYPNIQYPLKLQRKIGHDIGNSNIYYSLKSVFGRHDVTPTKTIRTALEPTGSTAFTTAQIEKRLKFIAAAKGGRAKNEKYQPMITENTRKFIELDKNLWKSLFHVIYCNDRKVDYNTIKKTQKTGAKLISRDTILTETIDDKIQELQNQLARIIKRKRIIIVTKRRAAAQDAARRAAEKELSRLTKRIARHRDILKNQEQQYNDTKGKP